MKGKVRHLLQTLTAQVDGDEIKIVVPYDKIKVFEVQIHFNSDLWSISNLNFNNINTYTDLQFVPIYSQRVNFETQPGSGVFCNGIPEYKLYVDPEYQRTDNITVTLIRKVTTPNNSWINVIFSYIDTN